MLNTVLPHKDITTKKLVLLLLELEHSSIFLSFSIFSGILLAD